MAMARRKPRKPLSKCTKHWSQAEIAERKRKCHNEAQARYAAAASKQARRARKAEHDARAFSWDRLLPHVEKRDDGCWVWTGPFRVENERVRPIVRAGGFGRQCADFVSCCLSRGRPPPRCFVTRLCETIGCIAPEHLAWTNRPIETAKRRRTHHDEKGMAQRRVE